MNEEDEGLIYARGPFFFFVLFVPRDFLRSCSLWLSQFSLPKPIRRAYQFVCVAQFEG
jgi:hypothetical protein